MTKKITWFLNVLIITNFLFSFIPATVVAQESDVDDLMRDQLEPIEEVYNPQQDVTPETFSKSVAKMINVTLGFLGIIFLVLFVYAGFMWMAAAGNDEKISKSKKTMAAAIIGTAIILAAYAISYFVIDQLLIATKGTGLE